MDFTNQVIKLPVSDAVDAAREAREMTMEKLEKKMRAVVAAMGMPPEVSNPIGIFYDEIDARLYVELDNWHAPSADRKRLDALFSRFEDALNPEQAEIYPASIERVGNQLALVVHSTYPYEVANKISEVLDEIVKEEGIMNIPPTRTPWSLGA